jgi:hypothetical protein|tara:strand:+ start:526 stop:672 length:147 start_codon:yes stop_codon:yes gene_type:complete
MALGLGIKAGVCLAVVIDLHSSKGKGWDTAPREGYFIFGKVAWLTVDM